MKRRSISELRALSAAILVTCVVLVLFAGTAYAEDSAYVKGLHDKAEQAMSQGNWSCEFTYRSLYKHNKPERMVNDSQHAAFVNLRLVILRALLSADLLRLQECRDPDTRHSDSKALVKVVEGCSTVRGDTEPFEDPVFSQPAIPEISEDFSDGGETVNVIGSLNEALSYAPIQTGEKITYTDPEDLFFSILEEAQSLSLQRIICGGAGVDSVNEAVDALRNMDLYATPAIADYLGDDYLTRWPFEFPLAGAWIPISDSKYHMYTLTSEGSELNPFDIGISVVPKRCAAFLVANTDNIRSWRAGAILEGIGRGTEDKFQPVDLNWRGKPLQGDPLYVFVEPSNCGSERTYYTLFTQDEGVSLSLTGYERWISATESEREVIQSE